ncbi:MAG: DUF3050 domain-containing protein [Thioploca sp.]|nr:DUF3050 domain-containing protein [Thioploca sp.]
MSELFNPEVINPLITKLNHHPVYGALRNQEDLRRFMIHHVYSVWDFMSLVKYLQNKIAPSQFPWVPRGKATVRYFINSLVLEEESDESPLSTPEKKSYSSHFELYCQAMREIGGDPQTALRFVATVEQQGIEIALTSEWIPPPSRHFTQTTFEWIATDQPHLVAAALAMGREQVIPSMFRAFLAQLGIDLVQAPTFHYYLNRHIHLDEDFHGPLSLQLLNELCGGEADKIQAAEVAAQQAILARLRFWDEVLEVINN